MATKYSLAELVYLRLTGGRPDQATRVDKRELMVAVGQAANEMIKAQYFNTTLPNGETIPEGAVLATYEKVPVTKWKNVSMSELPVMPVGLSRGLGVFMVTADNDPHCVFIPALPGQVAMLRGQNLVSTLAGFHIYEQYGNRLEYDKDLTNPDINIDYVTMRLLVSDIMSLGDNDPMPIPADYESIVVDTVFKRYAQTGESDKDTDVLTSNK